MNKDINEWRQFREFLIARDIVDEKILDDIQGYVKMWLDERVKQHTEEITKWVLNNYDEFVETEWRNYKGSKTMGELFLERFNKVFIKA